MDRFDHPVFVELYDKAEAWREAKDAYEALPPTGDVNDPVWKRAHAKLQYAEVILLEQLEAMEKMR